MIVSLFVVGLILAVLVLGPRLHEIREQLARARRERDACAHASETSMLASLAGRRPGLRAARPPAITAGHPDGGPGR